MASKVLERIYVERAKELLGWNCSIHEISEPVDFELQDRSDSWGIEVRQVFKNERRLKGSPDKEAESRALSRLTNMRETYYRNGGHPIDLKIQGNVPSASFNLILNILLSRQRGVDWSQEVIRLTQDVTLYVIDLPNSFKQYPHWQAFHHRIGWVRPVTSDELQHAIDENPKS